MFEVQGWLGAYTSYAAAVAAGDPYLGLTSEFLNGTGGNGIPANGAGKYQRLGRESLFIFAGTGNHYSRRPRHGFTAVLPPPQII